MKKVTSHVLHIALVSVLVFGFGLFYVQSRPGIRVDSVRLGAAEDYGEGKIVSVTFRIQNRTDEAFGGRVVVEVGVNAVISHENIRTVRAFQSMGETEHTVRLDPEAERSVTVSVPFSGDDVQFVGTTGLVARVTVH